MKAVFDITDQNSHAQSCRVLEALCEGYVQAMLEELDALPEHSFPCCVKCGEMKVRNAPLTPVQVESIDEILASGRVVSGVQRLALRQVLTEHGYPDPDAQPVLNGGGPVGGPEMPSQELSEIADYAEKTKEYIADGVSVPDWARAKITRARSDIGDTKHFLQYQSRSRNFAGSSPGASSVPPMLRVRSAEEIARSKYGSTIELSCYQAAMKRKGGADPKAKVVICCVDPGTFRGFVLMSEQHKNPEKRNTIDDPVKDARANGICGCEGSECGIDGEA